MITPEQLAKSGTEDGEQSALFCWCSLADTRAKYPQVKWLYAVPNAGQRHIAVGTNMVATGLRKGVPDVFLPVPTISTKMYAGLYVEMKIEKYRNRKNGGCTDEQIEWLGYLENAGYFCAVCYSWQEARDTIINYLEGRL